MTNISRTKNSTTVSSDTSIQPLNSAKLSGEASEQMNEAFMYTDKAS